MSASEGRISLWGIEVFVATAEEKSLSAAARRLGASPATVSQQLTNLEAAIGVRLLDRAARPVRLTPAGDIFLRRANAILNEADQARAELGLRQLTSLTRFRLGMIEDFDADVTPRLLASMGEELERCQFLLETGASHRLYDLLDARALDVIVAADTGAEGEGMEKHALFEEPFVLAVPKGFPEAEPRILRRRPMIRYTTRHHMGRTIAAHLAREGALVPYRFEMDSYHAIMAMVAAGAGWTVLTPMGWLSAQRFHEAVELRPLPFAPLSRSISLIARSGALGEMTASMAARLRPLLTEYIVCPAVKEHPWLDGSLKVLGE
ncbi:LysR family transcriptional regulator [Pseudoroseicyclus tamaricis]|uniref:LysR family transcriptional regulator n=1 Tax=Pseudoroseicyclus tamaricis TaxID=2705421 RepID=A0A6B2JTT2_9RHOB|nr:LysR family transcriptional regulator [Pseudoroseicyclus tamaricis]NDV01365.1 LysR family transcriptional regulator [Pseudoroseicyclus tamaricis]